MWKKLTALTLCLCLCLSLTLAHGEGSTLTDMKGREITLTEPVTRIVALAPSDCEILYALGAGDLLVGRGAYCDYPAEVTQLPEVNTGAETNLEEILALEPQVVIINTMAQTLEQTEALAKAGVIVVTSEAADIQGVYQAIAMLGTLTGKNEEAAALTKQMQDGFAAVSAKALPTGKTVYFEVSPLEWGLWTAGKATFMDEIAALCGLTNAFADVTGWAEISEEQVLERNPDYIVTITMDYGTGVTPVEEIKGRTGWESLTAVVNDQVFNADNNQITRPGPRLVDAAQALLDFVLAAPAQVPAA